MERSSRSSAVLAVCAGLWFGNVVADTGRDSTYTSLRADDPAIVEAGRSVYESECANCHGRDLEGQPAWRTRNSAGLLPAPPHDETGHTWHHADDLLFEITKYGPAAVIGDRDYRSAMPAYAGVLSDAEIVAALSYIKSRWPERERVWQDEINRTALEAAGVPDPSESLLERLFR